MQRTFSLLFIILILSFTAPLEGAPPSKKGTAAQTVQKKTGLQTPLFFSNAKKSAAFVHILQVWFERWKNYNQETDSGDDPAALVNFAHDFISNPLFLATLSPKGKKGALEFVAIIEKGGSGVPQDEEAWNAFGNDTLNTFGGLSDDDLKKDAVHLWIADLLEKSLGMACLNKMTSGKPSGGRAGFGVDLKGKTATSTPPTKGSAAMSVCGAGAIDGAPGKYGDLPAMGVCKGALMMLSKFSIGKEKVPGIGKEATSLGGADPAAPGLIKKEIGGYDTVAFVSGEGGPPPSESVGKQHDACKDAVGGDIGPVSDAGFEKKKDEAKKEFLAGAEKLKEAASGSGYKLSDEDIGEAASEHEQAGGGDLGSGDTTALVEKKKGGGVDISYDKEASKEVMKEAMAKAAMEAANIPEKKQGKILSDAGSGETGEVESVDNTKKGPVQLGADPSFGVDATGSPGSQFCKDLLDEKGEGLSCGGFQMPGADWHGTFKKLLDNYLDAKAGGSITDPDPSATDEACLGGEVNEKGITLGLSADHCSGASKGSKCKYPKAMVDPEKGCQGNGSTPSGPPNVPTQEGITDPSPQ